MSLFYYFILYKYCNKCWFTYRSLLKGKRCLNFVEVFRLSKRRMHFWELFQIIRWKRKIDAFEISNLVVVPSMICFYFYKRKKQRKALDLMLMYDLLDTAVYFIVYCD